MNLLDRIDLALKQAGKSRNQLAIAIEVTSTAIGNLKRRPGSTLRPENVARAARYLGCDLYWLCTGEGPEYVAEKPAGPSWGFLACEVAAWIDALPEAQQHRAFALVFQLLKEGHAPTGLPPAPEPPRPTRSPKPRDDPR